MAELLKLKQGKTIMPSSQTDEWTCPIRTKIFRNEYKADIYGSLGDTLEMFPSYDYPLKAVYGPISS